MPSKTLNDFVLESRPCRRITVFYADGQQRDDYAIEQSMAERYKPMNFDDEA